MFIKNVRERPPFVSLSNQRSTQRNKTSKTGAAPYQRRFTIYTVLDIDLVGVLATSDSIVQEICIIHCRKLLELRRFLPPKINSKFCTIVIFNSIQLHCIGGWKQMQSCNLHTK